MTEKPYKNVLLADRVYERLEEQMKEVPGDAP